MSLKEKIKHARAWLVRRISRTRIRGQRGNTLTLNDARLHGCQITFVGEGNTLEIGRDAMLHQSHITLVGTNNHLVIGAYTRIRAGGVFVVEDTGSRIAVGAHTTMTTPIVVCSEGGRIEIGEDCMIAMNTCIRNSDGHSIFNTTSGQRINQAADVLIADHVWLGIRSLIFKGATIGYGSIIGADSVVTGSIPQESLAVGSPARVVRENVAWSRERTHSYQDGKLIQGSRPPYPTKASRGKQKATANK